MVTDKEHSLHLYNTIRRSFFFFSKTIFVYFLFTFASESSATRLINEANISYMNIISLLKSHYNVFLIMISYNRSKNKTNTAVGRVCLRRYGGLFLFLYFHGRLGSNTRAANRILYYFLPYLWAIYT